MNRAYSLRLAKPSSTAEANKTSVVFKGKNDFVDGTDKKCYFHDADTTKNDGVNKTTKNNVGNVKTRSAKPGDIICCDPEIYTKYINSISYSNNRRVCGKYFLSSQPPQSTQPAQPAQSTQSTQPAQPAQRPYDGGWEDSD